MFVSVIFLCSGVLLGTLASFLILNALKERIKTFEDKVDRFDKIFGAILIFGLAFCMLMFRTLIVVSPETQVESEVLNAL